MFYFTEYYARRLAPRIAQLKYVDCEHIGEDVTPKSYIQSSDGSVVSFQKTVVAVVASLAVFLNATVAVVIRLR